MGLASYFRRKLGSDRASKAADQWWAALLTGIKVELPASHSTDDLTTQSILILRERHPEVVVTLQSRTLILSIGKTGPVSDFAWSQLAKGGYFPDSTLPPEMLFAHHARFMRENAGLDPNTALEEAREADRARHAIVIDP